MISAYANLPASVRGLVHTGSGCRISAPASCTNLYGEREKKKDNKRDGQNSSLSLFRHSLHVPTQHMHWRCGPPARHRLRCSIRIHVVIDEGRASFYLLVFFFVMCLCPHPPHLFISNIALAVFLLRCAHHHHPHAPIYRIIYRLHLRVRPVHDQQGTNLPRRP